MYRILILTGDAGEAQEIYYSKYRLEEEGWEVRIAAPARDAIGEVRPGEAVQREQQPGPERRLRFPCFHANHPREPGAR